MKVKTWRVNLTDSEAKEIAYWERNMLALRFADGWYRDTQNNYAGFQRVLSVEQGKMCFHIPDDFEVGNLPEIQPNWDGSSTQEKWERVLTLRGIK